MENKNKAVFWVIGIAVIVLVVIAAMGSSKNMPDNSGPIKIGIIAPLTGDAAIYGEPAIQVYQIAVDEINEAGGIDGNQIELVIEDGKCNGEDAVSAAQKLINVDGVEVIIGGFCSSESLAIVPVAETENVAILSAGSSSPDLTGKSDLFFRICPSDSSQGTVIAQAAYDQGIRKAAFIQEQTDYALGVYKAFSAKFESLGGVVVREEIPSTAKDFRSQLAKIKAENPDALFVDVQAPAVGDLILEQAETLSLKVPIMLNDILMGNPEFIAKHKDILEGAIGAEFGVDLNNPKFKHLADAYKAKYNKDLPYQSYAQIEYDSVYMIKEAIASVGYDGKKIAAWGHEVKDWQGASGLITIGSDGDRVGGHRLEIVKDGKVSIEVE